MLDLARLLTPWCGRLTVHVVPLHGNSGGAPPVLPRGLVHRAHAPVHDAHRRAGSPAGAGAHGIVTGECLGQVASQTMEAMPATGQVCTLPVLRPVVGMDKEEIVRIARKIGTFETSILPYEDCCTVFFAPRHPPPRAGPEPALDVESRRPRPPWTLRA